MRKKDIEKLIISQRENIVPDVYNKIKDNILPKTVNTAKNKKRFNAFKPLIASAAALILIAVAVFSVSGYYNQEMTTIYIDINPSLALTVSRNYNVLSVTENGGENLLEDGSNIVGMNVEDAAIKIIDTAIEKGYINKELNDNAIMVSAKNDDEKGGGIIKNINLKAQTMLGNKKITCKIFEERFDEAEKQQAEQEQIFPAKLKRINSIIALDETKTVDELKNLSVRELIIMLSELEGNNNNGNNENNGNNDNNEDEEEEEDDNGNSGRDNSDNSNNADNAEHGNAPKN